MSEKAAQSTPAPAPVDANASATPAPAAPAAAPAATETPAPAATEAKPPVAEEKTEQKKEEPAPERVVPEVYELNLSEGSGIDAAWLDEIKADAKESKLTNEEAQGLVGKIESAIARHQKREADAYAERQAAWPDQIKADPVMGGENAARAAEISHRFVEKYAPAELKAVLENNKLGNYPAFVRMIYDAAQDLGFDSPTHVIPGSHGVAQEESPAQILYGNKK